jgi:hypothetical protein
MANIKISQLPSLGTLSGADQFPVVSNGTTFNVTANVAQTYMSTYPGGVFSGAVFSATDRVEATGNITGGNIRTAGLISATGNITSGNLRTSGQISATGNITSGNITSGNIGTGTAVITTANITTANITTGNITSIVSPLANITNATIDVFRSANAIITGGTITGITDLTVADGGTGRSTLTSSAVLIGSGTSPVNFVSPGTGGNLLTSDGSNWVSQAQVTLGSFSIIEQGELAVNAVAERQVSNNKTTVLFVYYSGGQGGRGPMVYTVEWGIGIEFGGLTNSRTWYNAGDVDFQVAGSGSLLAAFPPGSGDFLRVRVNANPVGQYGTPSTMRVLIYQM